MGAARTNDVMLKNSPPPRSVLRGLAKSAKGAARTTKRIRNSPAPRSVLRGLVTKQQGGNRWLILS
jgi:hypothetical protein